MSPCVLRWAAQQAHDVGYLLAWLAVKVEDRTVPRRFRRQLEDHAALYRFLEGVDR